MKKILGGLIFILIFLAIGAILGWYTRGIGDNEKSVIGMTLALILWACLAGTLYSNSKEKVK